MFEMSAFWFFTLNWIIMCFICIYNRRLQHFTETLACFIPSKVKVHLGSTSSGDKISHFGPFFIAIVFSGGENQWQDTTHL